MANEAVIVELLGDAGDPISFDVADAATIEKGTILKLSGDRTAIASSGLDVFAGIAAAEKEANDGATTIAAHTHGIFDLKIDDPATITLGAYVAVSGANLIRTAVEADFPAGKVIGKALEAGSDAEVIQVLIGA